MSGDLRGWSWGGWMWLGVSWLCRMSTSGFDGFLRNDSTPLSSPRIFYSSLVFPAFRFLFPMLDFQGWLSRYVADSSLFLGCPWPFHLHAQLALAQLMRAKCIHSFISCPILRAFPTYSGAFFLHVCNF